MEFLLLTNVLYRFPVAYMENIGSLLRFTSRILNCIIPLCTSYFNLHRYVEKIYMGPASTGKKILYGQHATYDVYVLRLICMTQSGFTSIPMTKPSPGCKQGTKTPEYIFKHS